MSLALPSVESERATADDFAVLFCEFLRAAMAPSQAFRELAKLVEHRPLGGQLASAVFTEQLASDSDIARELQQIARQVGSRALLVLATEITSQVAPSEVMRRYIVNLASAPEHPTLS